MSRWSLGLAALLALSACAPVIPAPRLAVSQQTADLTLRLELPTRSVQYVEGNDRVMITIDGPDLTEPYTKLVRLSSTGSSLVSLTLVPVGNHRIVNLQSLDDTNVPIAGAVARTAGPITAGANTLSVSPATTALGEVATRLLALDREKKAQVVARLNWTTAADALVGYLREARLPHFGLLDTGAIAQAVHTANGTFPTNVAGLARNPGKVELRPTNVPPGATYLVAVADPASRPVVVSDSRPILIDNVAPGTWNLTLTPANPGLPTRTQSIQVVAGSTLQVPVDLAGAQFGAALEAPRGPGGSGMVKVGATDTLVMVGGTTYADATGLQGVLNLALLPAGGAPSNGPALTAQVAQAATAVHTNKLYWFGGHDGTTPVGTGFVYTPGGAVAATAALPGGLALRGASAGAVGDSIYVTGGFKADEVTLNGDTLAYDPVGDAWRPSALPALSPARVDMASAVIGTTWYVFGGARPATVFANGGNATVLTPQTTVSAYLSGATPRWEARTPMPTARSGATAVVHAGKIWVIGGAGLMGQPSAAVEVFDPATNAWETRQPLRQARAFPAVGVLDGKMVVAGGFDGSDPLLALPIATTEVITP